MSAGFPRRVVVEVQTDHRGEHGGSQRVAAFPTRAEAEARLGSLPDPRRRDGPVMEERAEWTYVLPDGRPFDPALGDYRHEHP
jgi:hypothetical protein